MPGAYIVRLSVIPSMFGKIEHFQMYIYVLPGVIL